MVKEILNISSSITPNIQTANFKNNISIEK